MKIQREQMIKKDGVNERKSKSRTREKEKENKDKN
jgi:hypothetical protein